MPADNENELFYWVDEDDKVLGSITRKEAHGGSRKIHRAVTVLVFNLDKSKMLLQQRAYTKDLNPGTWMCGVGGHVEYGEEYGPTAERELGEELGIYDVVLTLLLKYLYTLPEEQEFMPIYEIVIAETATLTPDPTEVERVEWCDLTGLSRFVATHDMSAGTIEILTQTGYLKGS